MPMPDLRAGDADVTMHAGCKYIQLLVITPAAYSKRHKDCTMLSGFVSVVP